MLGSRSGIEPPVSWITIRCFTTQLPRTRVSSVSGTRTPISCFRNSRPTVRRTRNDNDPNSAIRNPQSKIRSRMCRRQDSNLHGSPQRVLSAPRPPLAPLRPTTIDHRPSSATCAPGETRTPNSPDRSRLLYPLNYGRTMGKWLRRRDSNPRPGGYGPPALAAKLPRIKGVEGETRTRKALPSRQALDLPRLPLRHFDMHILTPQSAIRTPRCRRGDSNSHDLSRHALKVACLPIAALRHSGVWGDRRGSNPRPRPWRGRTLPS
jgi:hypothetical protein